MLSVSCVCVTHGRAHLIGEAIESFLRQDYPGPKELLIVNDYRHQKIVWNGSPQVKVLNFRSRFPNLGDKRNFAVKHSTGQVIFIWDDDDISLPWRISWSLGELARLKGPMYRGLSNFMIWNNKMRLYRDAPYCTPKSCYWKDALVNVGGYRPLNTGEDVEMDERLFKLYKSDASFRTPIPDPKVYYVYRWFVGSNHDAAVNVSSWRMPNDKTVPDSGDRFNAAVEKLRQEGKIPTGDVVVRPFWARDYVALTRRLIASGGIEMEISA